ncbi:peptidase inhibitor family I36 protein [Actinophytocola gossypii]|uniref:Peptidase inhibitor family I36 protein n=1 Tax=Actinophytocola gossypii TaxID=2812003 RepID=A0ABT2JH34_9PSEU|nr:peptidase inhibitor family I36 protein [Actinophytocola gossypii]MCT2587021.1 peptidase inhibitor family I36 protein [Actinophytocola gossypii]
MRIRSRVAVAAPLLAVAVSGLATGTATADVRAASNYDGVCQDGELCLYYNTNRDGSSYADFYYGVMDFATSRFIAPGRGEGQPVKNNAASACNKDDRLTARIYFNSGWEGVYDEIPPNTCERLADTYNENASFSWVGEV